MRLLFTEHFCCPPPCVTIATAGFLLFVFIIVSIFVHYPKQHIFDVAIKRLSHAVSQQGFL